MGPAQWAPSAKVATKAYRNWPPCWGAGGRGKTGKGPKSWISHIRSYILSCVAWHPRLLPRKFPSGTLATSFAVDCPFKVGVCDSQPRFCRDQSHYSRKRWQVGTHLENDVISQSTRTGWSFCSVQARRELEKRFVFTLLFKFKFVIKDLHYKWK